MNNEIVVSYPGGSGGNWLSNVIYCLEQNCVQQPELLNFHDTNHGCQTTHSVIDKNVVFLNGLGMFNIYLNAVFKVRVSQFNTHNLSISDQFEILASEASSKLFFLDERTDLNWDNLLLYPTQFVEELFFIMDSYDVKYTKNSNNCRIAIQNYVNTCINPMEYFNKWDNIYWLGWCNGISKHLWSKWPIVNSIEDIQEFLYPNKDFYTEFTSKYIVDMKQQ